MKKSLNLKGVVCPMNFVRTKLFLEEAEPGEEVEIILDEGDPLVNVTRSLKEEGHRVIKVEQFDQISYKVTVKKGEVAVND